MSQRAQVYNTTFLVFTPKTCWFNRIKCLCVFNYAWIHSRACPHRFVFSKQLSGSLSLTAAGVYQAGFAFCFSRLDSWRRASAVSNPYLSSKKCCFVSRMREALLSRISRSCYCNSFSLFNSANSQDKTATLMIVALHFALSVALVLPHTGLTASIPTPDTVDFAMKTGSGYHA